MPTFTSYRLKINGKVEPDVFHSRKEAEREATQLEGKNTKVEIVTTTEGTPEKGKYESMRKDSTSQLTAADAQLLRLTVDTVMGAEDATAVAITPPSASNTRQKYTQGDVKSMKADLDRVERQIAGEKKNGRDTKKLEHTATMLVDELYIALNDLGVLQS